MNLDDLKTVWKTYDRKLQSAQALNEKIIASMISERSGSRFSKVRRHYVLGLIWMVICLAFSILVIVTNPFDYGHRIEYIPMAILAICLTIMIGGWFHTYRGLSNINITHNNVDESLKKIIAIHEKPKKFFYNTIIVLLFSQTVLFPLSFLPRHIERLGLPMALAERSVAISVAALLLFIAFKLGAFKDRHTERFREDLNELQSLKAMSAELRDTSAVKTKAS
jgi:hypothetical protein